MDWIEFIRSSTRILPKINDEIVSVATIASWVEYWNYPNMLGYESIEEVFPTLKKEADHAPRLPAVKGAIRAAVEVSSFIEKSANVWILTRPFIFKS